uniref:Uncharacterized protein n=1 Tax=Anopheles coluzzii TaxID=1518534 RepID=A0A8W7PW68_ANOCL
LRPGNVRYLRPVDVVPEQGGHAQKWQTEPLQPLLVHIQVEALRGAAAATGRLPPSPSPPNSPISTLSLRMCRQRSSWLSTNAIATPMCGTPRSRTTAGGGWAVGPYRPSISSHSSSMGAELQDDLVVQQVVRHLHDAGKVS